MKIIITAAAILLSFSARILADYPSNIREGNKAYTAGDYAGALKYYKAAFSEKPNIKLGNFIVQLEVQAEKVVSGQSATGAKTDFTPAPIAQPAAAAAPERGISPASVMIVISDVALTAAMSYAYMDYNNGVDKYNGFYAQYDKTSYQDYSRMLAEYDKVEAKQNLFVISSSLASAAILYTFLDVFIFHAAFPVNVSLKIEKNGSLNLKTAMNRSF